MAVVDNNTETIQKEFTFTDSIRSNRSRINTIADVLDVDFYTSISSVVPPIIDTVDEDIHGDDVNRIPSFSIRQIYKNLIILSLAFVLMFTAYNGISALQSSLNARGNVGVNSLIVTYAFSLFSSMFLTGVSMDIFGLKWTIIIGEIAYILYIGANIPRIPALMYIAAALVGLAGAPLWTSQAIYIGYLARYYAGHKEKQVELVVSLFFGIFFAAFATSTIWGNAISYFVLNQSNDPQIVNCGIYFDPLSQNEMKYSDDVSNLTRYVLCGIYVGMVVISMVLLCFLLDQIQLARLPSRLQSFKKSAEVLRSFFQRKHIHQLLIVPLTMWTMIESAFLLAQFTRAFITCLVGIRFIGLVLICNGVCHSMSSYIYGGLVKYIDRLGCFIIAALINYAMILLMFLWEPKEDGMYILFIVAGFWGVAGAAWQSQVVAVYTILYSETDSSAIAKYRLWKAIGSLITYSYASYVTIRMTLIILLVVLTVSMVFYGIIEFRVRRANHPKESKPVDDED